jgi:hypothetical protein
MDRGREARWPVHASGDILWMGDGGFLIFCAFPHAGKREKKEDEDSRRWVQIATQQYPSCPVSARGSL